MNFAKFLRILFDITPPDDCFCIFFIQSTVFCHPVKLIETRVLFLNMFCHGFRMWWISRTLLRETDDLVVAAEKQTFLETRGVKRCFLGWLTYQHSYLYAYSVSVLHCPVILYLKFKEAMLPMWFTDSELFFKKAVLKHFAILTSAFNKFSGFQVNTGVFLWILHNF